MKKMNLLVAFAAAFLFAGSAMADDKVTGSFEASGHVVTGMGWQHQTNNVHPTATYGVLGKYGAPAAAKGDEFLFFVDEAEIDFAKSFGENIRARADLSFGGVAGIEQFYATANIPVGNGVEFLVGRFDAPIGFESNEVGMNSLISFTNLQRAAIRPNTLTGAKLYYAFSDNWDWHFWAANGLQNLAVNASKAATDMPAFGWRLGYNWGEDETQSTLGLSMFAGNEQADKDAWSFGGDVDLSWWVNDAFNVGGEVLFRHDREGTIAANANTLAGLINLTYNFSDVWDGTFRYAYTKEFKAATVASVFLAKAYSNEIALGGSYDLADDAKLMLEGRFDWINTAGVKSYDYGAALALAYNF